MRSASYRNGTHDVLLSGPLQFPSPNTVRPIQLFGSHQSDIFLNLGSVLGCGHNYVPVSKKTLLKKEHGKEMKKMGL